MSADLREANAEKSNALWDVWNENERLVLFAESDPDARSVVEIDFDGRGSGVVKSGRRKTKRYFERGAVAVAAIVVSPSRTYTTAKLRTVRAYAIVRRDRTSGEWVGPLTLCEPDGGVPQTEDEIAWRWLGGEVIDAAYVAGSLVASPSTGSALDALFDYALA